MVSKKQLNVISYFKSGTSDFPLEFWLYIEINLFYCNFLKFAQVFDKVMSFFEFPSLELRWVT